MSGLESGGAIASSASASIAGGTTTTGISRVVHDALRHRPERCLETLDASGAEHDHPRVLLLGDEEDRLPVHAGPYDQSSRLEANGTGQLDALVGDRDGSLAYRCGASPGAGANTPPSAGLSHRCSTTDVRSLAGNEPAHSIARRAALEPS